MSDIKIGDTSGQVENFIKQELPARFQRTDDNIKSVCVQHKDFFSRRLNQSELIHYACKLAPRVKKLSHWGNTALISRILLGDVRFYPSLKPKTMPKPNLKKVLLRHRGGGEDLSSPTPAKSLNKKRTLESLEASHCKRPKKEKRLQIILPNGVQKEFLIRNVPADGNCAFHAIDQKRNDLKALCIRMLKDTNSDHFAYFKGAVFHEFISYMEVIILGENGGDNDFRSGEDFVNVMTIGSNDSSDQNCQEIIKNTYDYLSRYLDGLEGQLPLEYLDLFFSFSLDGQNAYQELKDFLSYFLQEFIVPVDEYWLKISKDQITLLDLLASHNQKNLFVYMQEIKEGKKEYVLQNPLAIQKLHKPEFEDKYIIYNGRDHFLKLVDAHDEEAK